MSFIEPLELLKFLKNNFGAISFPSKMADWLSP
jgi:hypothetical protein